MLNAEDRKIIIDNIDHIKTKIKRICENSYLLDKYVDKSFNVGNAWNVDRLDIITRNLYSKAFRLQINKCFMTDLPIEIIVKRLDKADMYSFTMKICDTVLNDGEKKHIITVTTQPGDEIDISLDHHKIIQGGILADIDMESYEKIFNILKFIDVLDSELLLLYAYDVDVFPTLHPSMEALEDFYNKFKF